MSITDFLNDCQPRPLTQSSHKDITPKSLFIGGGTNGLEIALYETKEKPNSTTIAKVWLERRASRSAPVLTIIKYIDGVALCGPIGEQPPIFHIHDLNQAERLARVSLNQPDRHSAIRFLSHALPSFETRIPGITNEGLFALHSLTEGVNNRADWNQAKEKSKKVVDKDGKDLLNALGFSIEKLDNLTNLLRKDDERTALAVMLQEGEVEETGIDRFNNLSPISYALTKADKEKLSWVIFVQSNRIRLYSTENVGVGRRGRTETFAECQLPLLGEDNLSYLWLLFSAEALGKNGSVYELLENSKRFSGDLAEKLRDRIYDVVVPELASGIVKARKLQNPTINDVTLTYEMSLIVLFRLLFIAYAEDRDLLPYKANELYRRRSLKQKSLDLANKVFNNIEPSQGSHHWVETKELFEAIYSGNKEWGIPAYEGTIFSSDKGISKAGFELNDIQIENIYFEKALIGLLLTNTDENTIGPVDFRSLSVREFGTIYEGLLESELSLADQDLTRDKNGNYVPVKSNKEVFVKSGEVYLHDRSGARKSSGSFYTPDFAVEYLLDKALEPALKDHLDYLDSLDEIDASEKFFDFRVADIAMGSGHFLVAAIDRIERRLSESLDKRKLPGVIKELSILKISAQNQLKELSDQISIEDSQLLRRLIARRCIYGIDINPLSVQLSRLSIWIHSFVPGLPLSLLDHNLIHGNSLVGIDSIDEIKNKFNEASENFTLTELFAVDAEQLLSEAAEPLRKLARLTDATVQDIEKGRLLIKETKKTISPIKALCDIIIAAPISSDKKLSGFAFESWDSIKNEIEDSYELKVARKTLEPFEVLHLPLVFPEVFLREKKGFDVILGNPPWEEIKPEERDFWTGYFPGLRGLTQREQEIKWAELKIHRPDLAKLFDNQKLEVEMLSKLLGSGNFPGIEVGDADLYKAFAWRFWSSLSPHGGRIGVVLPRSAMSAKGSEEFRKALFKQASVIEIVTLLNNKEWIFENVHPQYTICLVNIFRNSDENHNIELSGPFKSLDDFKKNNNYQAKFQASEILSWNDSASIPLLPSIESTDVFVQLRKSPWLNLSEQNQWKARPDRELDASLHKHLMDMISEECPEGFWPVYKGESFDIWNSDTKSYYAWANPEMLLTWLYDKRLRSKTSSRDSAHGEFSLDYVRDKETLAPLKPRIAFRLITNRTNTRTTIAALVPPNCFLSNSAQYLLWPFGDDKDEAYLLGILSSIPLDWYARRFVELNFNFYLFNPLPIPRPERNNILWQRAVEIAGSLAAQDIRFKEWAFNVGVKCELIDEETKFHYVCELDAVAAHLYGLNKNQLIHIYETFHEGWDYKNRLDLVLEYYKNN